jgi:hypothetical protein
MIDHYDWAGGREAMLRFGPDTGPIVIAALPLFEEANRTRAFMVTICRALAERGMGSAIPDLPGQGESLVPTEQTDLGDLREAYRAQLTPQSGADLVRDLERVRQLSPGTSASETIAPIEIAGNRISHRFLAALADAKPWSGGDIRSARLTSDPQSADVKFDGAPLWRRAEPDNDPVLAQRLAEDIANWIATCGG